jgi:thiamine-phosphate pyrophosphorylase
MKFDKRDLLLYAVTDRSWLGGSTLHEQVEASLKGGATFIQLREKELDHEAFLKEAYEIKDLCRKYDVPFVINDDVEIAKTVDADGVHVGQEDMACAKAREVLGPDKIIGVSVRTAEQALTAKEQGADYLGVGAVFQTGSKGDAITISHEELLETTTATDLPSVAIGGISKDNIDYLEGSGVCGIAVISAIYAQEDIEGAARELKELCRKYFL